jgi:O-antigen ligase
VSTSEALGGAGRARTSFAAARRQSRLGWLLVAFVALTPIPLGSARPLAWAINAAVLAAIGFWYFLGSSRERGQLRLAPFGLAGAVLFALVCAWLGVQMLPFLGALAPVLGPAGVAVGNAALSVDPAMTWLTLLQFLSLGICALLLAQAASSRHRALSLLEALYVVVVAYAIYGLTALRMLGDTLLVFDKWAYFGVATGTFVNRNSFATFLAFGLVMGAGLALFSGKRAEDRDESPLLRLALIAVSLIIIAIALLATQSRMGLFAGLAGVAVTTLLGAVRLEGHLRLRLVVIAVPLVAAAVGFFALGGDIVERLLVAGDDLSSRVELNRQVWDMVLQRPLLGYGGGTFEAIFPMFERPPLSADVVWNMAHNTYLSLWSDLGMIAGSVPILLVAVATIRAILIWWRSDLWVLPAVAVGIATTAGLHSLVDFSHEIECNAFLFVALLVLGTAGDGRRRERGRPGAPGNA